MIALDTETSGLDWFDGDYPFLLTVSDYDTDLALPLAQHPNSPPFDRDGTQRTIEHLISNADGLVFHNAPFDIHMLVKHGWASWDLIMSKPIYDTHLLANVVLGEGNTHGPHQGGFKLKTLAQHYLDPSAGEAETAIRECMKSMGLTRRVDQKELPPGAYYEVWLAYQDIMEHYAKMDTRYTYDLFHVLMDKATDDHKECYAREVRTQPVLIEMEHRGVALNKTRALELYEEYAPRIEQHLTTLRELAHDPDFNPDGDKDVLTYLELHGVEIKELTPTGQPSTAAWVLQKYAGNPAVDALLEYRTDAKLMSTYIKPLQDRGVVHTSFQQIGAWTGRMSSRRPNLQNIPQRKGTEMRSVFIARPGHKLIVADYSSIEFRLVAYYCADQEMKQWIESGDPFAKMGERVYGTSDQSLWASPRQNLKNGTYAVIYGAGGEKLAQTIGGGMTKQEGTRLKNDIVSALGPKYSNPWSKSNDQWFRAYPDLGDGFVQRCRKAVKQRGYLRTIGRRIQRIAEDKAYVGPNAVIQGSAADIMKEGLVRAHKALQQYGGHLLLVVHDELVAEVPTANAEAALSAMRCAMESSADLVPGEKLVLATSGSICDSYDQAKD